MEESKQQKKKIDQSKIKQNKLKITSEPKLMLNKSFFTVKDLLPPNDHEYYKKKEQQLSKVLPSLFTEEERPPIIQKQKETKEIKQNYEILDAADEKILKQQSKNKLRLFMQSEEAHTKRKITELTESAFVCPICLDESTKNIYISKCQHKAHLQCWEKWLETKLECPLCKSRVRRKQLKEDNNA